MGRWSHGGSGDGLNLRLRKRAYPRGRPGFASDGPRWPILSTSPTAESGRGSRGRARNAGRMGRGAGPVRQLCRPTRLRDFRASDFLRDYRARGFRPADKVASARPSLPRVGLSVPSGGLRSMRDGTDDGSAHGEDEILSAGPSDCDEWRTGLPCSQGKSHPGLEEAAPFVTYLSVRFGRPVPAPKFYRTLLPSFAWRTGPRVIAGQAGSASMEPSSAVARVVSWAIRVAVALARSGEANRTETRAHIDHRSAKVPWRAIAIGVASGGRLAGLPPRSD